MCKIHVLFAWEGKLMPLSEYQIITKTQFFSSRQYNFIIINFSWTSPSKGARRNEVNPVYEAPTSETRPDHNTGDFVPYSLQEVCGFFNIPC